MHIHTWTYVHRHTPRKTHIRYSYPCWPGHKTPSTHQGLSSCTECAEYPWWVLPLRGEGQGLMSWNQNLTPNTHGPWFVVGERTGEEGKRLWTVRTRVERALRTDPGVAGPQLQLLNESFPLMFPAHGHCGLLSSLLKFQREHEAREQRTRL